MKIDSPDGLWGKHECGMAAVAICKACEANGSWNTCFAVPPHSPGNDSWKHVGFTWLIMFGALRPVPCLSAYWVVTKDFLATMAGRHDLPDALGANHGLYLPIASADGPRVTSPLSGSI
jgi:hypothetical protein